MNRYPGADHPNQNQNDNIHNTPNIVGAQKVEN